LISAGWGFGCLSASSRYLGAIPAFALFLAWALFITAAHFPALHKSLLLLCQRNSLAGNQIWRCRQNAVEVGHETNAALAASARRLGAW